MVCLLKREVRDIKGAAPVRATLIFYVFGDLPEKTHTGAALFIPRCSGVFQRARNQLFMRCA